MPQVTRTAGTDAVEFFEQNVVENI